MFVISPIQKIIINLFFFLRIYIRSIHGNIAADNIVFSSNSDPITVFRDKQRHPQFFSVNADISGFLIHTLQTVIQDAFCGYFFFLFSTDAFGGNEMNAENTTSFVGNNAHLVYYKSRDCEIAVEPATAPTTTPDESTIFNDCQIYSILGSDYYMSAGFNGETNAWGGGTATIENIDGRDVLHIANSNYLERGFNAHDVSGYSHVHFDVWTAEAMNVGMKLMAYDGNWKEGDKQSFTTNAGSWKSVDLALSGFNHGYLNKIQGIYPLDMQQQDIYFTNIYFYKTTEDVACYKTLNLAEGKPSEGGFIPGDAREVPAKANDGAENAAMSPIIVDSVSILGRVVALLREY